MLQIVLYWAFMNVLTVKGGGPHYCSPGHFNPCQNGATCIGLDGGHSWSCTCQAGYTGPTCGLIDCSSSLYCLNGGACSTVNGGTSYTCNCANGWKGINCEYIDCSSSLYCINGGTCSTANGWTSYTCNCANGWKGSNCEYIDCTSLIHCGNFGKCQPINGGRDKTCICFYGWTGPSCAQIDVCTPYKRADIVFVIDTSLSGGNTTFDRKREYVKNFMSKYRTGPPNNRYQFSLVTYSLHATVHFYLNTYHDDTELQNAVEKATYCGGPSFTGNALRKVHQEVFLHANGARDNNVVERYVVLLTDGLSSDPADDIQEANHLKADGIKIYAVGSGMSILHAALLEISSFKDYVFPMATEDSLQHLLKYTMFGCKSCSTKVSDVAVLMDVSSYITHKGLDTQIKALVHLLALAEVGPSATQFSYSMFADKVHNIYNFDTYSKHVDLIAEVSKKTKRVYSDNVDVANAFRGLYQNGFSSSNGSRQEARQIVILITSGHVGDIQQVKTEAKRLKDSGKIIVTIGVGLNANMTNLLEISSDPAFTYILGDDVNIYVDVLDSLKTTFVYDFCSHV